MRCKRKTGKNNSKKFRSPSYILAPIKTQASFKLVKILGKTSSDFHEDHLCRVINICKQFSLVTTMDVGGVGVR